MFAGSYVQADPWFFAAVSACAVKVVACEQYAAVLAFQEFRLPYLLDRGILSVNVETQETRAGGLCGYEDGSIVENRRVNAFVVRCDVLNLPEEFAIVGIDADDGAGQHGYDLTQALVLDENRGTVARLVLRVLAGPNGLACVLVQGDDADIFAARGANEIIAVDEQRFAEAPSDVSAVEFFEDVE